MPLTEQHIRLAVTIDRHVNQVLASGGGDEELLLSMSDHMGTFKQLLDMCSHGEIDILCQQYDGVGSGLHGGDILRKALVYLNELF